MRFASDEVVLELAGAADVESGVTVTVGGVVIAIVEVEHPQGRFMLFTEVDPFTGAQWAIELGQRA